MCDDFLFLRTKFTSSAVAVVKCFQWPGGVPSNCMRNVTQIVARLGGSCAYGWGHCYCGPISASDRQVDPVYSRWVNHVLWRDGNGQLWEVSPSRNRLDAEQFSWKPTLFLSDDSAQFAIEPDGTVRPGPAVYIAQRPEGEWTADCLCHAERAPREMQDEWLQRAMISLKQAGLEPTTCEVERTSDLITNVWLWVA